MAEAINELLLEHMKRMQDRLGRIEGKIDDLAVDIRGIKEHQAGFYQSELAQDRRLAELATRVDRIEARLDLRDQ